MRTKIAPFILLFLLLGAAAYRSTAQFIPLPPPNPAPVKYRIAWDVDSQAYLCQMILMADWDTTMVIAAGSRFGFVTTSTVQAPVVKWSGDNLTGGPWAPFGLHVGSGNALDHTDGNRYYNPTCDGGYGIPHPQWKAGDTVTLFTVAFPSGPCEGGIRLYRNGTDPWNPASHVTDGPPDPDFMGGGEWLSTMGQIQVGNLLYTWGESFVGNSEDDTAASPFALNNDGPYPVQIGGANFSGDVSLNDVYGVPKTNVRNYTIPVNVQYGTLNFNMVTGTYTYTPPAILPVNGALIDTFVYQRCDSCGSCKTAKVTFSWKASISGTVYDDEDGLKDGQVDGTGIGSVSGQQLYAYLVDATNKVLKVVPVAANGTYLLDSAVRGFSYTVVISPTVVPVGATSPTSAGMPAGWAYTGDTYGVNNVSGIGIQSGIPDFRIPLWVADSDVVKVNFGVEQLPNSGTLTAAPQINPGGTNVAPVSPSVFSGTDPDPNGKIDSLRIISFPTNTTTLVVNGVTYTSATFPTAGITVPTNSSGQPTVGISVDPVDGDVDVVFTYATIDNAGKEDPTPGTATVPFDPVVISGVVYDDEDGIKDGLIDGTGIGTPGGQQLYAYLVDGSNNIVDKVAVSPTGTYTLTRGNGNTSYTVVISTADNAIGSTAPGSASLPSGWVSTGDGYGTNNTSGTGIQSGTPDLRIPVTTGLVSVTNVNFGIEQLPNSGTATAAAQPNPNGTNFVSVPASVFSGTDPDPNGKIDSLRIISFPTNTTAVTVNGVTYTPATFPAGGITVPTNSNGQPSVPITIDPVDGAVTPVFTYTTIDNAGKEDPTPGTANVPFFVPAPVELLSFEAAAEQCRIQTRWTTGREEEIRHYELQQSVNGASYEQVALILPKGSNSTYTYSYEAETDSKRSLRLKISDNDGSFRFSKVLSVSPDCADADISVYPNPFTGTIWISGLAEGSEIRVFNSLGQQVHYVKANQAQMRIDLEDAAAGMYMINIQINGAEPRVFRVVKE